MMMISSRQYGGAPQQPRGDASERGANLRWLNDLGARAPAIIHNIASSSERTRAAQGFASEGSPGVITRMQLHAGVGDALVQHCVHERTKAGARRTKSVVGNMRRTDFCDPWTTLSSAARGSQSP